MTLFRKINWKGLSLLCAGLFMGLAASGCAQTGAMTQNVTSGYDNMVSKLQGFSLEEEQKLLTDSQQAFEDYKTTRLVNNEEPVEETTTK